LIRDLETINEVSLHGAWFDISTGQLLVLDEVKCCCLLWGFVDTKLLF
jgi:carbonic anhydrase